jgi:hypothetical protein
VCLVEWAERLPAPLLPHQRLEVRIEALSDAEEQQQQQQAEAQQQRVISLPAGAVSASASGSGGGSRCEVDCEAGGVWSPGPWDAGAGDVSAADEDDDPYSDRRWRRVQLVGVGGAWQARLAALDGALAHAQGS